MSLMTSRLILHVSMPSALFVIIKLLIYTRLMQCNKTKINELAIVLDATHETSRIEIV